MTDKKEEKKRLEFRPAGARKFYAPDRDLLGLMPAILKAAIRLADIYVDPKILTDEAVKDLVDVAGSVYTDSLELIPAEKVLENFHTGLGKLDPVVQAQFMRSVVDGLMLGYVNSIRDAAEKPILTEQQLASSMISLSLLSFMNPDEQERLKAAAAVSGALTSSFGEATGLFELIKAEDANKE